MYSLAGVQIRPAFATRGRAGIYYGRKRRTETDETELSAALAHALHLDAAGRASGVSPQPVAWRRTAPPAQITAPTRADTGTGIRVHVDLAGTYIITTRRPQWTLSGNVGHHLSSLLLTGGTDRLGRYQEIAFTYRGHVARADSIRVYASRPIALFRTTYLAASSNSEPFPTFTTYHPHRLFHLSYHGPFGVYRWQLSESDSPWLFLDAHANGFLLSPAANFLAAALQMQRDGSISSGISQEIRTLPAHFTQTTLLAVSNSINGVYTVWGQALTTLLDKERPGGANPTLDRPGYWTDHGAAYYYHTLTGKGYEGTLQTIKHDFARMGISLGYMELDSWWYPKGTPPDWRKGTQGIALYTAASALFPAGLAALLRQLGLPLMVHARWIDAASPYRARYKISGNVSVDPRYWQTVMNYLRQSGVIAYEQDWLSTRAQTALNLVDPGTFLSDMAAAARADGLTLQYCMPAP